MNSFNNVLVKQIKLINRENVSTRIINKLKKKTRRIDEFVTRNSLSTIDDLCVDLLLKTTKRAKIT